MNYNVFKFESQVTIPLLSEFFNQESNVEEILKIEDSFKDFVNHIKSFLASLEDNKVYKIIPCIKKPKHN